MNKEDISNIPAGREMDALIAEKVMGGFISDPDAWSNTSEVWFWIHPKSGVLIGMPYTSDLHEGKYSHSWRNFCPSVDIAAAWQVIEKMKHYSMTIESVSDAKETVTLCSFFTPAGSEFGLSNRDGWAYEKTAPLAICRAALLAIARAENVQPE